MGKGGCRYRPAKTDTWRSGPWLHLREHPRLINILKSHPLGRTSKDKRGASRSFPETPSLFRENPTNPSEYSALLRPQLQDHGPRPGLQRTLEPPATPTLVCAFTLLHCSLHLFHLPENSFSVRVNSPSPAEVSPKPGSSPWAGFPNSLTIKTNNAHQCST